MTWSSPMTALRIRGSKGLSMTSVWARRADLFRVVQGMSHRLSAPVGSPTVYVSSGGSRRASSSLGVGKLVSVDDQSEPTDVVDRLLWRDATQILSRPTESDGEGPC